MNTKSLAATLILCFSASAPVLGNEQGAGSERVMPQFSDALPGLPDKALKIAVVEYPPGAKSLPHHHAPSALVYAYVMSGAVRSSIDGGAPRVYRTGEGWSEEPRAHHTVSENASSAEPARLLVVFIVKEGEALTTPDP